MSRGITEKVTDISEELDFGPISHGPLEDREQWLNQHAPLEFGKWDWLANSEARFRKHVMNDTERLIWIAPASATEQAGLYWYLSQFGGNNLRLAVADFPFTATWNGRSPLKLGELGLEAMGQLYEECPRVLWEPSEFPEDRWSAFVAEGALLRVINDGQLQSAPDTFFDSYILARCPEGWDKWHRVIANSMGDIWDTEQAAGSDLLLWRLRTLIEEGRIECDGDLPIFDGNVSEVVKIRRVK